MENYYRLRWNAVIELAEIATRVGPIVLDPRSQVCVIAFSDYGLRAPGELEQAVTRVVQSSVAITSAEDI